VKVRDDPHHPDPGFAALYAALPDADDLWPWLDWCAAAGTPVLYLGIGAGRLGVPLRRAGIEIVGVDAHPGMLAALRRRAPEIETHEALIEDLRLRRRFGLVIGPSSILASDVNLEGAVRHLRAGGRVGMELMNPAWLRSTRHRGVRLKGRDVMEVDYRLPDGSTVVQVVEGWRPLPSPRAARQRLSRFGLELLWLGTRPGTKLADAPTYFVLAGRKR
jgi:trans-aconitate methyltransferase